MNHALSLYLRLIGIQIRSQMQYRVSFWADIAASLIIVLLEFGALALVLQRFETIAGWTVQEVALLYGSVEFAFGLMDLVFAGFDPHVFGVQVRQGRLDQLLLRPLSLMLQVFGSEFATRRFGKIALGGALFFWALGSVGVEWTAVKLLLLPTMLVSLFLFFGALYVFGATITIWTVESVEAINVLTYGGSFALSHPMSIYQTWLRRFFTYIFPAIFLNYYPILYILEKPDPFGMTPFAPLLAPLVGAGAFLLALRFWRYGLQQYQSTGT